MQRGKLFSLAAIAGGLVVVAYAKPVHAQAAAAEYIQIVLDQTGSMNQSGQDLGDGRPHGTTFDNAISGAQAWVQTDQTGAAGSTGSFRTVQRAYSIWTFKDDNCCGGTQTGLKKIWPLSTSNDCTEGNTRSNFEASTGYCLFDAGTAVPYGSLLTTLDSLRVQQAGVSNSGDPNHLLSPIALPAGTPPGGASFDPQFGLGPNTPLASSLTDAVEHLDLTATTKNRIIIFESDGGENFSNLPWGGAAATTFPSGNTFNTGVLDWGFGPSTSPTPWEINVLRRITRLGASLPIACTPPDIACLGPNQVPDGNIIGQGPVKSPSLGGTDAVPAGMTWRIDILYAICDPNFPQVLPCVSTSASRTTTSPFKLAALTNAKVAKATPSPFQLAALTGSLFPVSPMPLILAQSTTTTATRHPSIAADELSFFTALGHVTPKSSFRAIVRDPTVKFGTTHKLAGDVDDSGCVDGADFSEVTQSDVYFQRAVLPNQLAIRCDLNADGWVNRQDAQIVLNNWGHGCINPVGPKPKIP